MGRAGQRRHGIGGGADDQAGHGQVAGEIGLLEQQEHDGRHSVDHHEQAHAAVGQHGNDQNGDQHDVFLSEPVNKLVSDGGGAA
ncbi:hypothetical protein SDC9_157237 [bioreactor metagenome]|uniref:Uncharacterized protein n=1 Tax=bioreactor metagenome TaxID=1076179 RepID=A0A645FBK9_9ZZZZ